MTGADSIPDVLGVSSVVVHAFGPAAATRRRFGLGPSAPARTTRSAEALAPGNGAKAVGSPTCSGGSIEDRRLPAQTYPVQDESSVAISWW